MVRIIRGHDGFNNWLENIYTSNQDDKDSYLSSYTELESKFELLEIWSKSTVELKLKAKLRKI